MAASKLTRLIFLEEIYRFQKKNGFQVGISWSSEFKEAAIGALEELLSVTRNDLSNEDSVVFDQEIFEFVKNLPRWWFKVPVRNNKKQLIKHHNSWLNHEITLPSLTLTNEPENALDPTVNNFSYF